MGSHTHPDWTPQEIIHLKELCDSGLYPFDKLAKQLGRSKSGTMYKCYEQGFGNKYIYKRYSHKESFFQDISLESSYWAGIIATDGCISHSKGASVLNLTVSIKDIDHLERWKLAVKATNPIKRVMVKCNISTKDPSKEFEHCFMRLDSAHQLISDLSTNFGITNNKTLRGPPPNLPSIQHQLAYIRGFIDGDGSLTLSHQKGFVVLMVCGCNREMISWIKDIIDSLDIPHIHPAKRPSLVYQPPGESCYYWCLRGFRAAVLVELLKRLSVPNMTRKWDNPRLLEEINHWKQRVDRWPPESFFTNILSNCISTTPALSTS